MLPPLDSRQVQARHSNRRPFSRESLGNHVESREHYVFASNSSGIDWNSKIVREGEFILYFFISKNEFLISENDFLISENDMFFYIKKSIFWYQKWISDIRKWFSDIKKWFSDIKKWFSDIKKWFSFLISKNEFLISKNDFLISKNIFWYQKIDFFDIKKHWINSHFAFGWKRLEDRRKDLRLALLYKIVHGHVAVPVDALNLELPDPRTRKKHKYTYKHLTPHTDPYKHFFLCRTIPEWNSLPARAVEATSVESFKTHLAGRPQRDQPWSGTPTHPRHTPEEDCGSLYQTRPVSTQ